MPLSGSTRPTTRQLSMHRSPRPFAARTLRYGRVKYCLGETTDPSPVRNGEYRRNSGLFTGHDPTRGSGQGGFKISWVGRVGSLRFKMSRVGSGRVRSGQEVFKISRIGSGRVKRLQNLAGRVGSGQEVSKSRGSGRVGSRGFQNLAGRVGS